MKKIYKLTLVLIFLISTNACTKTEYEEISLNKTVITNRNIIIISSNTPANIRISYCKTDNGISNKLIEDTIRTPYVLEMKNAIIEYDSLDFVSKSFLQHRFIKGVRKIKHNFDEGGAEYICLENLSNQTIKFAVIGTQRLETKKNDDNNFTMIDLYPKPIYKGVPLLYLLKPELAPNKDLYFNAIENYNKKDDMVSFKSTEKKIELYTDKLGNFKNKDIPFSIDQILSIYENESNQLFFDYVNYSLELLGVDNANEEYKSFLKSKNIKMFNILLPNKTFYNKGTVPILPLF